jgi:SAM-dependent methyltransferase
VEGRPRWRYLWDQCCAVSEVIIAGPAVCQTDENFLATDETTPLVRMLGQAAQRTSADFLLWLDAEAPLIEAADLDRLIRALADADSAVFTVQDQTFAHVRAFRRVGFLELSETSFGRVAKIPLERPKDLTVCNELAADMIDRALQLRARRERHLYWRDRPCPPGDFERAYWGDIVDPDGQRRNRLAERAQRIADVAEEVAYINQLHAKPGRILDIGCGMGELLSAVGSHWQKYGLELSAFAAEEARQQEGIVDVFVGQLGETPYPPGFFDLVVMHHVVEHLPDPIGTLQQVQTLLGSGGRFIIATPDFDGAMARRYGERYRLLHDPTHISLFSRVSLRALLEDHGFEIERESFPYFDTRHFSREQLLRLLETDLEWSPPFWGSFMTFYCIKRD